MGPLHGSCILLLPIGDEGISPLDTQRLCEIKSNAICLRAYGLHQAAFFISQLAQHFPFSHPLSRALFTVPKARGHGLFIPGAHNLHRRLFHP